MKTSLHLQFRGMEATDSLQQLARKHVERLTSLAGDVMACRVSIEQMQKHQHQGRPYGVMIDLTLPGHELAVNRVQNEDVYVAVRDAFDAIQRKLEAVVQKRRGQIKHHET